MPPRNSEIIAVSTPKALGAALASLALAAGAGFFLWRGWLDLLDERSADTIAVVAASVFVLPLCLLWTLVSLMTLLSKEPVSIGPEGVRALFYAAEVVPWSAIVSVNVKVVNSRGRYGGGWSRKYLQLGVAPAIAAQLTPRDLAYQWGLRAGGCPENMNISAGLLQVDVETLKTQCDAWARLPPSTNFANAGWAGKPAWRKGRIAGLAAASLALVLFAYSISAYRRTNDMAGLPHALATVERVAVHHSRYDHSTSAVLRFLLPDGSIRCRVDTRVSPDYARTRVGALVDVIPRLGGCEKPYMPSMVNAPWRETLSVAAFAWLIAVASVFLGGASSAPPSAFPRPVEPPRRPPADGRSILAPKYGIFARGSDRVRRG
jgi:hypothetical protein